MKYSQVSLNGSEKMHSFRGILLQNHNIGQTDLTRYPAGNSLSSKLIPTEAVITFDSIGLLWIGGSAAPGPVQLARMS